MIVKILDKKEVAKGTLRVEFSTPQEVNFKPGQYMNVTLIDPPETDAEGNSRLFSIVNSPLEKKKLVLTTRLRDTAFKRVLRNLPIGSEVEIDQIGGNFILPETTTTPLVFIAGGIGVTPFLSILSYIDQQALDYQITLLYANRDKASAAYFEELNSLSQKNPQIKVIFIMTSDPSWTGEKNHLNAALLKKYFPEPNSFHYFLAGPPAMVKASFQTLLESGVKPEKIKAENFSGY